MSALVPPQPAPAWTHSPEDVARITQETIDKDRKLMDKIAALKESDCTFDTVFLRLAQAEAEFDHTIEPLAFYQNVSPSKELRDASNNAESAVREYGVDASMRLDIFRAKQAAAKNIKDSGRKLTPEEQRLVDKMIQDGTRAGLALPDKERAELMALKKELSNLCLEFNATITFTAEELKGVPADVVSGYIKRTEDGKEVYDVTYKTPDIFPIFKFAENPETRKRAYEGYESRLSINVTILDRVLALRRQIASMLGYDTWADYVTEVKMVKNAKGVVNFLSDLEQKLRPVGLKDRETLLAMKQEEHKAKGLPFDGEFYIWDYRYYDRKYIEETLDLDDMLVKEYFPVDVVVPAILQIYQNLLGVKFIETKGSTWHPEVQQFAVWENDAKDASGFIGYCYLDLFPRESKYSHAAVWGLLAGYDTPDGKRSYPLTAMVANLAKPTPNKPALMRHDDVVTFFHEMGHVFHGLLSKTRFARFHGTSVARDFVEAPSQMLENWCWEPKVLEKMSSHYETKKPLSPELIEKLVKSRYVNVGLFYLRQLFFANFDIKVHTMKDATDYTKLWNELREQISFVKGDKPTPGQGTFGHIAGGYDAGYYGATWQCRYTYSLVFAADMYATVFKADPLDPARGQRYREKILLPGGSREELDSLKDFLGREPNSEAFIKELFGDPAQANLPRMSKYAWQCLSSSPPQATLSWTHSPEDVARIAKKIVEKDRQVMDEVAALKEPECNFETVFLRLAYAEAELNTTLEPLAFYQNVSPSQELRDASTDAEAAVREYIVDASMRLDIFRAKQAALKNITESGKKLTPEEQRLMDKMILDGTRAGLALPEERRVKLAAAKKELSNLCVEYSKNINEEKVGTVSFTLEELKGVPKDVISGYTKRTEADKELYDVTFRTPDIIPIFKYAENPETRKRAYNGFEARVAVNEPVMGKVVALRREVATMLGYDSWADYATEVKMVKNAKNAVEFLSDLEQRLRPMGQKDRANLLALKQEDHEQKGLPFDGELYEWDSRYYERKYVERTLDLDDALVKEYFPVDFVTPAILQIYQNLLGLKFVEVQGETWHPDVQQFAIWEEDAKDESGFLGYCYFDLYPRGKYDYFVRITPFTSDCPQRGTGKRSYPVSAMVANLAKPTPNTPALMRHEDVVALFHEIGHIFHEVLSKTRFSRFHGTTVALDFGEAPSQMLENWCWEPRVLEKMSSHYETKKPLSPELIDKLVKRHVDVSCMHGSSRRKKLTAHEQPICQLWAVLSQTETTDYTKLWSEMRESIYTLKTGKPLPGQCAIPHFAGDYSAGYYGYNYSLVFAMDMYATVFKADPLDPARGRRYREKVLLPGSSQDELDLLKVRARHRHARLFGRLD
ncbi:hypothetical protein NM688_g2565 [Phlebia brevispora]|uniref:Uncharacterized protein n=1 Tax=Phlebia brevispora TaxID=194682 RepID=A0ACC1T848_9APHY|nr:hypothetical protein NM688_g2565 [Phlebia brevispora]